MITKLTGLTDAQLEHIKRITGEAFVGNELFHNWGSKDERRDGVMKYMALYTEQVYRSGNLYANEDMTGFIGLEDSTRRSVLPVIKMLLRMLVSIKPSRLRALLKFTRQISGSNAKYARSRHIDVLMVCVDKEHQGRGIATGLVRFAMDMADREGVPLLFDTDMKEYSQMYQHLGCELYNTVKADNGVTRYSLCYTPKADKKIPHH